MAAIPPPKLQDMRVKCSIQSRVTTQDIFGHPVSGWVDYISEIWASIEDMVTPYILQAFNAELPTQRFMIKVRYRPGIVKAMRVLFLANGRVFIIDDINNIGQGDEWIALRCTEIR